MSPLYIIDLYVDLETQTLKNSDGTAFQGRVKFIRGTEFLVRCSLVDKDFVAYPIESGTSFLFGMDSSFSPTHPEYVLSQQNDFNIPGDWPEISFSEGKICWRVNTNTNELRTFLGSSSISDAVYFELWAYPPSGNPSVLFQFPCSVQNIVVEPMVPADVVQPSALLISEAEAIFAMQVPQNGLYRIKDGNILQIRNTDSNLFHSLFITGPEGSEQITIGVGE